MAPAEYITDRARDRRLTNQRASPACDAMAPPVATPAPTSNPWHSIAPKPLVTTVAISNAPTMVSMLPNSSVLRTPKWLTLIATRGPGSPDMIMYTENMLPKVSRGKPKALAMAGLMTAGP